MKCLFIGGELDGKVLAIAQPTDVFTAPVRTKEHKRFVTRTHTYTRRRLNANNAAAPETSAELFVLKTITNGEAVRMLIDGYRRPVDTRPVEVF